MDVDGNAAYLSAQRDRLPDYEADIWRMPVSPARRPSSAIIDWSFAMPDGSRFTAPEWSSLRQAAKAFLWSLHEDPPGNRRRPLSLRSLPSVFRTLRSIILWMAVDGTRRFADIDEPAIDRFLTVPDRGSEKPTPFRRPGSAAVAARLGAWRVTNEAATRFGTVSTISYGRRNTGTRCSAEMSACVVGN